MTKQVINEVEKILSKQGNDIEPYEIYEQYDDEEDIDEVFEDTEYTTAEKAREEYIKHIENAKRSYMEFDKEFGFWVMKRADPIVFTENDDQEFIDDFEPYPCFTPHKPNSFCLEKKCKSLRRCVYNGQCRADEGYIEVLTECISC